MANVGKVLTDKAVAPEELAAIRRATAPNFWGEFDQDPLGTLEFLENRIAPLASDADMLFLRYVGTDLAAFAKSFDRMKIVDGTTVPPGKRGFMFSKFMLRGAGQAQDRAPARMSFTTPLLKRGKTIATRSRSAAPGEAELDRGEGDHASARRAADGRVPYKAAERSSAARKPTSASCWRSSSGSTTATSSAATTSSTTSWRRR